MSVITNETFEYFRKTNKDYKLNQAKLLLKNEGYVVKKINT